MSKLQEIEARRAARKAALAEQEDTQRAEDLEALDALEVEHGDSNIAHVDVAFTPGLPTLAAVKAPSRNVIKRYRDRVKPRKNGQAGDPTEAAIELCGACRVYPDAEVFAQMLEARPGLDSQLGLLALRLAVGVEEEKGKD